MSLIRISHRGNIDGPKPQLENNPRYILRALSKKLHVEVDVWFVNGQYYLGHDEPVYPVDISFLKNIYIICHAKNIPAFHHMLINSNIHCFWHENDYITLTSRKWAWKYPEVYYKGKLLGVCGDVI